MSSEKQHWRVEASSSQTYKEKHILIWTGESQRSPQKQVHLSPEKGGGEGSESERNNDFSPF